VVTSLTEFRNTASEVRLVVPLGPPCLGPSSAAAAASSRACDTTGAQFLKHCLPHNYQVSGPLILQTPFVHQLRCSCAPH
jgi:hypothetical protein